MLAAATRALTPIALVAAVLAILVPSKALANHSDLLLAALVLLTALGISFSELKQLSAHWRPVLILSVAPVIVLGVAGWALGHAFDPAVRDGLLGTGLASSEVASVGLVSLAGADATIALGAVTGSLIVSALLGPLAIGLLGGGNNAGPGAGGHTHIHQAALLGRFALVVILPLIVGVAIRSAALVQRWLQDNDDNRDGLCALVVAALVYAALSGDHGAHHLGSALLAAAAFLAISGAFAYLWQRSVSVGGPRATTNSTLQKTAVPGAFAIAMRDFAVAAALATQAFGTAAGTVPGVYGVLMLIGGSIAATRLRSN
jgi:bile acid:Na+ symporter, BASS family